MMVREFARRTVDPSDEQLFGIEVEVEGFREEPRRAEGWKWQIIDDGSLRNNGAEFLSNQPWDMATCVEQVNMLYDAIAHRGYVSNVRTGIHVHANCLDYTIEQVGGILATYCILEPLLFAVCGEEREEGIYCVPWYRAPDQVDIARSFLAGAWQGVGGTCKYSALYLEPLRRFGTIEFRQAPTFESRSDMIRWIELVDRLITFGKEQTAESVVELYNEIGAEALIRRVFGTYADEVIALVDDVDDLIDDCDAVANAESLLPCTYKAEWEPILLEVEGDGHTNYHRMNGSPLFDDEYLEPEYYDDEEYYDEEEY